MSKEWSRLTKLTGGAAIVVKAVQIADSEIEIRGEFQPPQLAMLTEEDQVFIVGFLRSEGSIKEMEKLFGVSYPTIKNRLAKINEQLGFVETLRPDSKAEILAMLERGELTAAEAVKKLKS